MIKRSETPVPDYELSDPDVRLMLRVCQDDEVAFEQLMRRYESRVKMLLERLVGRGLSAEDLSQDVFLRIYRARKRYEPRSKFSTWLYTIVRNVAFNARRSRQRESDHHHTHRSIARQAGRVRWEYPSRELEQRELRGVVEEAMKELNERQRAATWMSNYADMSYPRIAEMMETSPAAVKSLVHRARLKLRDRLTDYVNEGRIRNSPGLIDAPP